MKTKLISKTLGGSKRFIVRHKIFSSFLFIIIAGLSYWGIKNWGSTAGETRYVLGSVTKETIIASVTGSGQVSSSNQIDLKAKVSGDVTSLNVAEGQHVKSGTLLLQLDSREAQKAVRDAEANLQSAQLSLAKLTKPADALSLTQAENSLAKAQDVKQNSETDLQKAYDDGFNSVSNAFLNLPSIMSGLYNLLYTTSPSFGTTQSNLDYYANATTQYDRKAMDYRDDTDAQYKAAKASYDAAFDAYKSINRFSGSSTIEAVINKTYDTTKTIAQAIKSSNNLVQFYEDKLTQAGRTYLPIADTHLTQLNSFTQQTNTNLTNLLNAVNTIKNDKSSINDATRSIAENTESLAKLKNGTDPLDIQSAQLTVTQRQNALTDARDQLGYYSIRAPFDGTVAKINVKKFDSVGNGTAVVTFITNQQFAELSLNEVDAAKIKAGQKTTLTFDAIDGLTITGKVAEVDSIGAVSQGVVTYNVKIAFDTQDDRIKAGMTVNAAIITDSRQNVLAVPSAAVKTQNGGSYVQMIDGAYTETPGVQGVIPKNPLKQQSVQTGLSNDTLVEITSDLNEGDQIVVRTIAGTTGQTTSQAPSLFGNTGRATGGAARTTTGGR